ncbi:MAG: L-proline amide hydrolase [Actinobacteria bacterium]|nr:L-proline amide hydrolase [Actinomycetota bacterium]
MATKDRSGYMIWKHGRTWFRVIGDLNSPRIPLVVLHGGPGSAHNNVLTIAKLLSASSRPVIVYDQIGCGKSTPLRSKPAEFWTIELFEEELSKIIKHLKIEERYILAGASWGGMLAMNYAIKKPKGLKGLIIANSLPSSRMWVLETRKLVAKLPTKHRNAIYKYEKLGKHTSKEYLAANTEFANRHIRQIPPLIDNEPKREFGKHVYEAMWGPTEFTVRGSLKDWNVEKELHRIKVPTFFINGERDEATPAMQRFMKARVQGSEYYCIKGAAHYAFIEAPLEWMQATEKWLTAKKL